jgi:alkylhydroperoxidase family enzyme
VLAETLTRVPGRMREADLAPLRAAGFDDAAIHDAVQVISYFNYINRVADALHVDLEPEMPPDPRE